jgi:hypothetical protein
MHPCHVDYSQFRGFAFRNETAKDIAVVVNNESAFPKEFLLRPMQVYYAFVADLIALVDLEWAKKSGFKYLEEKVKCSVL